MGAPPYTGLIGFSDGVAVCFREARTSDNREDRFEGVEAGFLGGGGGGGGGDYYGGPLPTPAPPPPQLSSRIEF